MAEQVRAWPAWWLRLPLRLRRFVNNFCPGGVVVTGPFAGDRGGRGNWESDVASYALSFKPYTKLRGKYDEAMRLYRERGPVSEEPDPTR